MLKIDEEVRLVPGAVGDNPLRQIK